LISAIQADTSQVEAGDEMGGYRIELDAATAAVQVTAWGFWSVEVASSFAQNVLGACRRDRRTRVVVMDLGQLKPMRDEGQHGLAEIIAALPSLGVEGATFTTASQLTKLQIMRIVNAHDRAGLVRVVEGRGTGWVR
jgi:hypothetical protein